MPAVRLTLELIADSLRGPACMPVEVRPALGIRLLDLSPVVVEAPPGQALAARADARVTFGGRGKALVFSLPAEEASATGGPPVPLWLMALGLRPGEGTAAVLLASCCVDLRPELSRLAADGCAGGSPRPFRRCSFQMQHVQYADCDMTLDCYLRLYAGGHRPLAGGELLLEPSAVEPLRARGAVEAAPLRPPEPGAAGPAASAALARGDAAVPGGAQAAVAAPAPPSSRGGSPCGAPAAAGAPSPPRRPGHLEPARGAFFPAEIRLGGAGTGDGGAAAAPAEPGRARGPTGVSPAERQHAVPCSSLSDAAAAAAISASLARGAASMALAAVPPEEGREAAAVAAASSPPRGAPRGDSAGAAASLPLVSEMLRELWQVSGVSATPSPPPH